MAKITPLHHAVSSFDDDAGLTNARWVVGFFFLKMISLRAKTAFNGRDSDKNVYI